MNATNAAELQALNEADRFRDIIVTALPRISQDSADRLADKLYDLALLLEQEHWADTWEQLQGELRDTKEALVMWMNLADEWRHRYEAARDASMRKEGEDGE